MPEFVLILFCFTCTTYQSIWTSNCAYTTRQAYTMIPWYFIIIIQTLSQALMQPFSIETIVDKLTVLWHLE